MTRDPDRGSRSEQSDEEQRPAPASGDGPGGHGAAGNIGEIMGQVARALQEEHGDVEKTLAAITHAAVNAVPGADECGITLVTSRKVESRVPAGELPGFIDALQDRLGEGPCLDAVREEKTVRIEDLRSETRWPRFAAEAADAGLGSVLSFQLFVTGDTLGALNLYSRSPHAFDEESESVGLVFASHAAIALAGAQNEENLRTAISTRDLIGQAKGILMERFKVGADQAFAILVGASSRTNRKLTEIAEELCRTGVLVDNGRKGR